MMKPIRGSFGLILFAIFLLHASLMMLQISIDQAELPKVTEQGPPIKVRILSEKKQIVQSEDSENKDVKDDAYLSDKDRSFDRQTRAKKVDTFKQASKGGSKSPKEPKKDMKLSDLGALPAEDPFKTAAREYSKKKQGQEASDIQAEEAISSTNDHVEEVPLGDVTNLNTAEYKYYGFYHRIRQRLEQYWGASIQEKARNLLREGRNIADEEDLITSLRITLDSEGEIVAISLLGSSGVRELDEAAIESFNDAGPFPNPPKGMVKNGRVTLEWGFVVET